MWCGNETPTGGSIKDLGKDPTKYYFNKNYPEDSIITQTQSHLSTWRYPDTDKACQQAWRGKQYWFENSDPQYKFTGQAFFPEGGKSSPGWGKYNDEGDIYTHVDLLDPNHNESRDIAYVQLNEAVSYEAGMLMAVSKSLPPLVKGLEIAPAIADVPEINCIGNKITFKILENRIKKVTYAITIDKPYEFPPKLGTPPPSDYFSKYLIFKETIDLADGTLLPWEKDISYKWNGKLANGSYPYDGKYDEEEHTLYVKILDQDGNTSSEISHKFKLKLPPKVAGLHVYQAWPILSGGWGSKTHTSYNWEYVNDKTIYNHLDTKIEVFFDRPVEIKNVFIHALSYLILYQSMIIFFFILIFIKILI